jgi:mitochondrial fission protein ELM1
MTSQHKNSTVIWRLLDGKPGHEKQSYGLVNAIKRKTVCDVFDIPVKPHIGAWVNYVAAMWPQGQRYPHPDLIIGAGHHTHLHLLAAKKAFGGKTVVLMQPSLPVSMFDLALIPAHDNFRGFGRFIETRGVLNAMSPVGEHHHDRALIMIGGHSRHFAWNTEDVIAQVEALLMQHPTVRFTLTTSRRTPAEFIKKLQLKRITALQIVPFAETSSGWVEQQLALSAFAWITEDSVSMVYEALTAQVAVGVINLKVIRENRVANGLQQLVQKNMVVRFDMDGRYQANMRPMVGFREADVCANFILNDWLVEHDTTTQPALARI